MRLLMKHPCPGFPYSVPCSSALCAFPASSTLESKAGKADNPLHTLGLRLRGQKVGKVSVSVEESQAKAEGKAEMPLRCSVCQGTPERAEANLEFVGQPRRLTLLSLRV